MIDGDELMVVSGIGEWAHRVRELRVQFGWWIYSGVTLQEMAEDSPEEATLLMNELDIEGTTLSRSPCERTVLSWSCWQGHLNYLCEPDTRERRPKVRQSLRS